jgi:hypothetical protein
MKWPPLTPDVTILDILFCSYIRNIVYSEEIRDLNQLQEGPYVAIENIRTEMLVPSVYGAKFNIDSKWCMVVVSKYKQPYENGMKFACFHVIKTCYNFRYSDRL